jgi:hypothetical protein
LLIPHIFFLSSNSLIYNNTWKPPSYLKKINYKSEEAAAEAAAKEYFGK